MSQNDGRTIFFFIIFRLFEKLSQFQAYKLKKKLLIKDFKN